MNAETYLFRAYLVDDEPLALRRLARLLQATKRVEIAGTATDPEAALQFLSGQEIDVLFLDIQMPGMNGFELIERLPAQPMVIFTTAYDQFALKAFEVNSIDYLLKPVEPEQLDRALAKLERWRAANDPAAFRVRIEALFARLAESLPSPGAGFADHVPSRVGGHIQFIDLKKITHFTAEDKLTYAVADGKKHVVDYTITELEQKLAARRFVRIHRSTLLNLAWVGELHSWFGGQLVVRLKGQNTAELTVARDRVRMLKEKLGLVG
ncbi:MAG TPA: LytTR family DNA-binding domain-containing protein [Terriglobia bacterium]|nr:LytTR family DNA-binding domain-containing protein [Terriglobia bacterium]